MIYHKMIIIAFLAITLVTGCEEIITQRTAKKQPSYRKTTLSEAAEKNFWDILYRGDYDKIPAVTQIMTAAYLENPNNPKLSAHLGFLYLWQVAERQRLQQIPVGIINDVILSQFYFADASTMEPDNAIYQGFYGDAILVAGHLIRDQRLKVHGYFQIKKAIRMWPEFNWFAAGYPLSILPVEHNQFQEALTWQWKTLERCALADIDKKNPDFAPYMHLATDKGPSRACWSSKLVPHNFEGFMLNMGDMLVKNGDVETGIKIYQNAKLSPNYATWPYRSLLEHRIANAKENVANFRKSPPSGKPETSMIFASGRACVVCHQAK